MAKKSVIYRNRKRQRMADNQATRREELKAIVANEELEFDERMAARDKLNKLPRNGCSVRVRRRCALTGRGRGVYRKFEICRIKFRDMASAGELPGVTKSSW